MREPNTETVRLEALEPGTPFMLASVGIRGRLVRKGVASATVELMDAHDVDFKTVDGEHVHFTRRRERMTWSLATRVVPADGPAEAHTLQDNDAPTRDHGQTPGQKRNGSAPVRTGGRHA